MKISVLSASLMLVLAASCSQAVDTTAPATSDNIAYMGRTLVTDEGNVAFNYPGVTAMVNFTGTGLEMLTSPGSGSWMVEVDSLPAVRMEVAAGDSVLVLAQGLEQGQHSARVAYCIEGYEKHPEFRGFTVREGRLLDAPAKGKLKMEFIGNSITCGYGTEADSAQVHFSYDTENHTLGYAYLTARALDADFNMVARSGIGIYRNYNGPREGDSYGTMPLEYDNTMLYDSVHPWDFARFTPDVVCINLGTNDTSTQNYDIALYEQAYGKFLDRVRGRYPEAKIVLLTGAMLHEPELSDVTAALDRLAASREGVYRFDMTPEDGSLGYGADYHPSRARAKVMAGELTQYLRSIL